LHIRLVNDTDEVLRRRSTRRITGGRIVWIGGARDRESIKRQLDTGGTERDTGIICNAAGYVVHQPAVIRYRFGRSDRSADVLGEYHASSSYDKKQG
jgi:hypothetical protein